jgi:hypothetical protein
MDAIERPVDIRFKFGDDPATARECLEELRKLQGQLSKAREGQYEFFDPGLDLGFQSDKTIEKNLEAIMRGCIWRSIALKLEFHLKLLYTIDGYLSAIATKNPVSSFLLTRYLLELAATISEIDFQLEECVQIDVNDWKLRGLTFLASLFRARHSTSDEKTKLIFAKREIPTELTHPIKIGKAIKRLASRPGFHAAPSQYQTLSNICHHNGSGRFLMLTERIRETNTIVTRSGKRLFFVKTVAGTTMGYPSSDSAANYLTLTARVASWCAHSANKLIDFLREVPFSDKELRMLTGGRIKTADDIYVDGELQLGKTARKKGVKVGRNHPCPCSSGKKYKHCCWKESA